MTLYQLGEEYLRQAEDLKRMIAGYSALRKDVCGIELYELNSKITVLREMERDTRITGNQLMEYYAKTPVKKVYRAHRFN